MLTAVAMQPIFVAAFWRVTWDDSAITLAFARTFAQTGVIEGTAGSGIIEGYSTPLWMFAMAAIARIVGDAGILLTAAKVGTCLLGMGNVVLVRQVLKAWGEDFVADLTAGVFGLLELTIYESINAMETPLMLTLLLTAVLFLPRGTKGRPVLFTASLCLFVLVRFEAILLALPLLLFVEPWRRRVMVGAACALTFLASELARLYYFGSWLPATIQAKRHLPYSAATRLLELKRHLLPAITLSRSLAMPLIVLLLACGLAWISGRSALLKAWSDLREHGRTHHEIHIAIALGAAGLLLDFGVGQNWGPTDRELFAALPFLVYLLLRMTMTIAGSAHRRSILSAVLLALVSYRVVRTWQRMAEPAAPLYMPMITVQRVASLATPVEQIREAANLPELTFATPDVGGVMLFGKHLRVLDLGLLCDRRLSRTGYAGAADYLLTERRPEVFEVHSFWTSLVGVEFAPALYENYVPMVVNDTRYFVRRDVFARFADRTVSRDFTASGIALAGGKSAINAGPTYPDYADVDSRINRKYGTYATFRE